MRFADDDQRAMLAELGEAAVVTTAGGPETINVQAHLQRQVEYSGGEIEVVPPWLIAAAADVAEHGITGDQDSGTVITVGSSTWRVLSVETRRDGFCVLLLGDTV